MEHYIMIKRSIHKEDIMILNVQAKLQSFQMHEQKLIEPKGKRHPQL